MKKLLYIFFVTLLAINSSLIVYISAEEGKSTFNNEDLIEEASTNIDVFDNNEITEENLNNEENDRAQVDIPQIMEHYNNQEINRIQEAKDLSKPSLTSMSLLSTTNENKCGDNLYWLYDETTFTLTITGLGDMTNYGSGSFPWSSYASEIKRLVLPEGLTTIANYAFANCFSLTSIFIPNSVTTIGTRAFYDCNSLTSLSMPISASFDTYSFYNVTKLVSIHLTKGTSIGNSYTSTSYKYTPWYRSRVNLKEIILDDGIVSIGSYSFADCTSIASIYLPSSISEIECIDNCSPFLNCSKLAIYTNKSEQNDWDSKWNYYNTSESLFVYYDCSMEEYVYWSTIDASAESIVIPDYIKFIPDEIFWDFGHLRSVYIPSSVTTIYVSDDYTSAFYKCSSYINPSAVNIYTEAELDLDGWGEKWNYHVSKKYLNVYYNCSADEFYYWTTLDTTKESITIPDYVTFIKNDAFSNCSSLKSITIPDSVASIGDNAFYGCSSLITIIIPNSVTYLGKGAFASCTSLTSITFSDSVVTIGADAFNNCGQLRNIYISDIESWLNINFSTYESNPLSQAAKLIINNQYVKNVDVPNTVTKINNYAFYNYSLETIYLPDSIDSIGNYSFYNCSSLNSINISNSINSIGNYAFYGCSSLTSIEIPETCISIGNHVFYGCSSLVSITLPISTSVGLFSYSGANSIETVHYTKGTGIGSSYDAASVPWNSNNTWHSSLKEIILDDGITSIGAYTFYHCPLSTIAIPNSVTSIGTKAFTGSQITSINIPESVERIGDYAFSVCDKLSKVNISNIESWLKIDFKTCFSNPLSSGGQLYLNGKIVTDVIVPNAITRINDYVFYNCNSLKMIIIPDSIVYIGAKSFGNCTSLESIFIPSSVEKIVAFENEEAPFFGCSKNLKMCVQSLNEHSNWDKYWNHYDNNKECSVNYGYSKLDYLKEVGMYYYSISFNGNGSTSGKMSDMKNLEYDKTYTLNNNEYSRKGYEFVGWNTKANGTGKLFENKQQINKLFDIYGKDIVLYAQWILKEYTITYDLDGGSYYSNKDTYSIVSEDIQLKNPIRTGYCFLGWYDTNNKKITRIYSNSCKDYSLKAKWELNTYKIKYVLDKGVTNGSKNPTSFKYSDNEEDILYLNNPTKKGIKFLGWYLDDSSIESNKLDYDEELDKYYLSLNHASDYNLVAKFDTEYEIYNITYLGDLASFAESNPNPLTYTYNTAKIILLSPIKLGYTFLGFYNLDTNKKVTTIANHSMGSLRLEARWQENKYKLAYNVNGGKTDKLDPLPKTSTYTSTQEVTLTDVVPTKVGYTFLGWSKDKKATEATYNNDNRDLTGINENLKNNSTITLYAVYEPISYNLSLDYNGGSVTKGIEYPASFKYTIEDKISLPTLSKPGYKFNGWYSDVSKADGTLVPTDTKTGLPKSKKYTSISKYYTDIALEASFSPITYKITYNTNGGKITSPKGSYNTSFTIETWKTGLNLPEVEKKGYIFDGWYYTYNKSTKEYSNKIYNIYDLEDYSSYSNSTLYAKWTPITYTITYNAVGFDSVTSKPIAYDSKYALSPTAIDNPGYQATGYYYYNASGKQINLSPTAFVSNLLSTSGNVNIYSKGFKQTIYTITYNGNGGTGTVSKQTYVLGEDDYYMDYTRVRDNRFTRKGYVFNGWNTKADGSGYQCAYGLDYYVPSEPLRNLCNKDINVTLYAQWVPVVETNYKVRSSEEILIKNTPDSKGATEGYIREGDCFEILEAIEINGEKWCRIGTNAWIMDNNKNLIRLDSSYTFNRNNILNNTLPQRIEKVSYDTYYSDGNEELTFIYNDDGSLSYVKSKYASLGYSWAEDDYSYSFDSSVYGTYEYGDDVQNTFNINGLIVKQVVFDKYGKTENVYTYRNSMLTKRTENHYYNNGNKWTYNFTYQYDDLGRLLSIVWASGSKYIYEYNGDLVLHYSCIYTDWDSNGKKYWSQDLESVYRYDENGRIIELFSNQSPTGMDQHNYYYY